MKTNVQRRLALLAGLLLLALLVIAVGVQVVQAMAVTDSGTGGGSGGAVTTAAVGTEGRGGVAAASVTASVSKAQAGTRGRGGIASVPFAPATGAQSVSSGSTSRTAWIVAGSVAAALIVGLAAWALVRRRRQYSVPGSAAYCSLHPDDALCGVA